MRCTCAVLGVLAICCATGTAAQAAATLHVDVRPPTPGTAEVPNPVAVGLLATFSADAPSALPASVRRLEVRTPDGFATSLATISSCTAGQLESGGSAACPAGSRLGSGSAEFLYVVSGLRIRVKTDEVSIFRGEGDGILVYGHVSEPAPVALVLPGTLSAQPAPLGPLLTLDLGGVAPAAGGGATVIPTRAQLVFQRGLAAGPCPAARWTFKARLSFDGGGVEEHTADVACSGSGAPDITPPVLRATASNATTQRGARLRVRLSEAATLSVALERRGRRRWVALRRTSRRVAAGSTTIVIRRVNGRPLAAGRYRARLRAVDAAGLASARRTVTFALRAVRRG